jgi:L-methionine (R)-S-oxide reductase
VKKDSTKLLQDLGAYVLADSHQPVCVKKAAELIRAERGYRWVGIYKVTRGECVIVAGTGDEPPTYRRFPATQGLCGAVVESQETLVVPDVQKDLRYLPTFWNTRSEILVPIRSEAKKRVCGILDAESDKMDAFSEDDQDFLEHAAVLLAQAICAPKKHNATAG